MPRYWHVAYFCLAGLLLAVKTSAGAEAGPSPLRLVSGGEILLEVPRPTHLIEAISTFELFHKVQELNSTREFLHASPFRRFLQVVGYFEKNLGKSWLEAVDQLADRGLVVSVSIGDRPSVVMVLQGKNEALLKKLVRSAVYFLDEELDRNESPDHLVRGYYRHLETFHLGNLHFAAVGSSLVVSNEIRSLHNSLDLSFADSSSNRLSDSKFTEVQALFPSDCLAKVFINLAAIRKANPGSEQVLKDLQAQPFFSVLFGGWLGLAKHSPFVCVSLQKEKAGFLASLRLAAGRDVLPKHLDTHIPPPGQIGSLPLLAPPGTLFSSSYYLDVSKFWEHRQQYFGNDTKNLDEFDKNSRFFLGGNRFSKLISQTGAHQRLLVGKASKPIYQTDPSPVLPSFAWILELRKPKEFGRSMEAILRSAALLVSVQTKIKFKLVEEKRGDEKIIAYIFTEEDAAGSNVPAILFNFSPAFATVGDQFVVASTLEMARSLVDVLKKEDRKMGTSPAALRVQISGSGTIDYYDKLRDQVMTGIILNQALSPRAAQEEWSKISELYKVLGTFTIETHYEPKNFHIDFRLTPGLAKAKSK